MTLDEAVIQLHYAARTVEQEIGRGQLSDDIRDCADRLHQLVQYDYTKKESNGIQ